MILLAIFSLRSSLFLDLSALFSLRSLWTSFAICDNLNVIFGLALSPGECPSDGSIIPIQYIFYFVKYKIWLLQSFYNPLQSLDIFFEDFYSSISPLESVLWYWFIASVSCVGLIHSFISFYVVDLMIFVVYPFFYELKESFLHPYFLKG